MVTARCCAATTGLQVNQLALGSAAGSLLLKVLLSRDAILLIFHFRLTIASILFRCKIIIQAWPYPSKSLPLRGCGYSLPSYTKTKTLTDPSWLSCTNTRPEIEE